MYDDELRDLIEAVRGQPSVICSIIETNGSGSLPVTLDPTYDEGDPTLEANQMMAGGAKLIVCAASHFGGVRHRYRIMQQVKGFADHSILRAHALGSHVRRLLLLARGVVRGCAGG
jgi:hypothetical protein